MTKTEISEDRVLSELKDVNQKFEKYTSLV